MPVAKALVKLEPANRWQAVGAEVSASWQRDAIRNLRSLGRRLTPDEMCSLTRSWYARWDSTIGPPNLSACSKGCSICCRRYVSVSAPEVIVACDELSAMESEKRERFTQRLRDADNATHGMDAGHHFSTHTDCPFVDTDGACAIYPARPLACRYVHSVSVEQCHELDGDPDAEGDFDARTLALGGATHRGFRAGLAACGYHSNSVAFIAAVRKAVDDPDSLRRWTSGEDAFADVPERL